MGLRGVSADAIARGLIGEAYEALAAGPGAFVPVLALRRALGGRVADLDGTLVRMHSEGEVNLVPQENQMMLTPADRAAAVRCGGEDKHRMSWED